MPAVLRNAKSMTGRLALFFTLVSIVIGLLCLVLMALVLRWSEDRVGERRIILDKQEAISYFLTYPNQSSTQLDILTTAYNGLDQAPPQLLSYLKDKQQFLGEVGAGQDSRMVYMTSYTQQGKPKQIVLVSRIDEVEITPKELVNVLAIVLVLIVLLILCFAAILTRLSKSLIRPINDLREQLEQHQGDINRAFFVSSDSAQEFKILTTTLNQYRSDIDALVKREQAFARYASHELRTPLTIIKGSSTLLAKEAKTPFAERQLHRIQAATEQMLTIVDALLGLVRYEKSQSSTPERVITATELNKIVFKQQAQADAKQLDLICEVTGSPTTQATHAVLDILIGNLVRNSIAATNQGTIMIAMSDHAIEVTDEGDGLSSSTNSEGHGLGLLIVQDICQRYHWKFSIKDRETGGCSATIIMKGTYNT